MRTLLCAETANDHSPRIKNTFLQIIYSAPENHKRKQHPEIKYDALNNLEHRKPLKQDFENPREKQSPEPDQDYPQHENADNSHYGDEYDRIGAVFLEEPGIEKKRKNKKRKNRNYSIT